MWARACKKKGTRASPLPKSVVPSEVVSQGPGAVAEGARPFPWLIQPLSLTLSLTPADVLSIFLRFPRFFCSWGETWGFPRMVDWCRSCAVLWYKNSFSYHGMNYGISAFVMLCIWGLSVRSVFATYAWKMKCDLRNLWLSCYLSR